MDSQRAPETQTEVSSASLEAMPVYINSANTDFDTWFRGVRKQMLAHLRGKSQDLRRGKCPQVKKT